MDNSINSIRNISKSDIIDFISKITGSKVNIKANKLIYNVEDISGEEVNIIGDEIDYIARPEEKQSEVKYSYSISASVGLDGKMHYGAEFAHHSGAGTYSGYVSNDLIDELYDDINPSIMKKDTYGPQEAYGPPMSEGLKEKAAFLNYAKQKMYKEGYSAEEQEKMILILRHFADADYATQQRMQKHIEGILEGKPEFQNAMAGADGDILSGAEYINVFAPVAIPAGKGLVEIASLMAAFIAYNVMKTAKETGRSHSYEGFKFSDGKHYEKSKDDIAKDKKGNYADGGASAGAGAPDPNDDWEPGDDRKTNPAKAESKIWKELKHYKGNIKTNGERGSKLNYYKWDFTHNDIEVFDSHEKHLGSMNPETGKIYKPAVPGRKLW